jgi:oligoribonuclease NrnB/cAMP/cGMP phosphodiesterase (DHH superfamily)
MNKNLVEFSHTDWDGMVSAIFPAVYYGKKGYNICCQHCNYDKIDADIIRYINSSDYREDDVIFITDISVSYETALILDNLPNEKVMIDHHKTAYERLSVRNKGAKLDFKWMFIREEESATYYTHKYFMNKTKGTGLGEVMEAYKELVYYTNLWDTKSRECVEYKNSVGNINRLNALFSALGSVNFKTRFTLNPSIELSESEIVKVETTQNIIRKYCKKTRNYVISGKVDKQSVLYAVMFADSYKSDIADFTFKTNGELLYAVILDMNSCTGSLRRNNKHDMSEHVSMDEIAKTLSGGGGGHPFAAGFGFSLQNSGEIIARAFSGNLTR